MCKLTRPVTIHIDNTGAEQLIKTRALNKRTKHIDIRFHFLRDLFEEGLIHPVHIDTKLNIADAFTKPLSEPDLLRHRDKIVQL